MHEVVQEHCLNKIHQILIKQKRQKVNTDLCNNFVFLCDFTKEQTNT